MFFYLGKPKTKNDFYNYLDEFVYRTSAGRSFSNDFKGNISLHQITVCPPFPMFTFTVS